MSNTGDRIRSLREARGLTVADLGRATGIDGPALSRWERGVRGPSLSNAVKLARYFGVTVEALFADAAG